MKTELVKYRAETEKILTCLVGVNTEISNDKDREFKENVRTDT